MRRRGVLLGTVIFARVLNTDEASETIRTWIGYVLLLALAAMLAKIWVGRRASGLRAERVPMGTEMPVRTLPTLLLGLVETLLQLILGGGETLLRLVDRVLGFLVAASRGDGAQCGDRQCGEQHAYASTQAS